VTRPATALGLVALVFTLGEPAAARPETVTFGSAPDAVGDVWWRTGASTMTMNMNISTGGESVADVDQVERRESAARVTVLAVTDGRPHRLRLEIREAWREAGAERERQQLEMIGGTYEAERGPDDIIVVRTDGVEPTVAEVQFVINQADDLLGQGGLSPEESLLELLVAAPVRIGQRFELDEERAKVVFVGMPAGETDQWSVAEASLVLEEQRTIDGESCGLFAIHARTERRRPPRVTQVAIDGEICVATRNGRWLTSTSGGPTDLRDTLERAGKMLDVHAAGGAGERVTWARTAGISAR